MENLLYIALAIALVALLRWYFTRPAPVAEKAPTAPVPEPVREVPRYSRDSAPRVAPAPVRTPPVSISKPVQRPAAAPRASSYRSQPQTRDDDTLTNALLFNAMVSSSSNDASPGYSTCSSSSSSSSSYSSDSGSSSSCSSSSDSGGGGGGGD